MGYKANMLRLLDGLPVGQQPGLPASTYQYNIVFFEVSKKEQGKSLQSPWLSKNHHARLRLRDPLNMRRTLPIRLLPQRDRLHSPHLPLDCIQERSLRQKAKAKIPTDVYDKRHISGIPSFYIWSNLQCPRRDGCNRLRRRPLCLPQNWIYPRHSIEKPPKPPDVRICLSDTESARACREVLGMLWRML